MTVDWEGKWEDVIDEVDNIGHDWEWEGEGEKEGEGEGRNESSWCKFMSFAKKISSSDDDPESESEEKSKGRISSTRSKEEETIKGRGGGGDGMWVEMSLGDVGMSGGEKEGKVLVEEEESWILWGRAWEIEGDRCGFLGGGCWKEDEGDEETSYPCDEDKGVDEVLWKRYWDRKEKPRGDEFDEGNLRGWEGGGEMEWEKEFILNIGDYEGESDQM
jgi:hypothetical protein